MIFDELFSFVKNSLDKSSAYLGVQINTVWYTTAESLDKTRLNCYIDNEIVLEHQDTISVDVREHGKRRYKTDGIMVVSLYAPLACSNGYSNIEYIAQHLKNDSRKSNLSCFSIDKVKATPNGREFDCYRYDVYISYSFFEIV